MAKVTVDAAQAERVFRALKKVMEAPDKAGVKKKLGGLVIKRITERTRTRGQDADTKKFLRYSLGYAKWKGVSRSAVDLTLTGEMLNSLSSKSIKNGVEVYFGGRRNQEIAAYHITGAGNLPKRDFFDIGRNRGEDVVFTDVIIEALNQEAAKFR